MKKINICIVFLLLSIFFGFNSSLIDVKANIVEENTNVYSMKSYITPTFNEHETSSNNITVSFTLPDNLEYSYTYQQSNLEVSSIQKNENIISVTFTPQQSGNSYLTIDADITNENNAVENVLSTIYMYTGDYGTTMSVVSNEEAAKLYELVGVMDKPSDFAYCFARINDAGSGGSSSEDNANSDNVTITGTIMWTDLNNNYQYLQNTKVEIWDMNGNSENIKLGTAYTNNYGIYSCTIVNDLSNSENGYDIRVKVLSETQQVKVVAESSTAPYFATHPIIEENVQNGKTITKSIIISKNKTNERSFQVLQSMNMASEYVYAMEGEYLDQVSIVFPSISIGTCFDLEDIHIIAQDYCDWDVMQHEYGHYARYKLTNLDAQGGYHLLALNMLDDYIAIGFSASTAKEKSTDLCWNEGVATYFSYAVQNYFQADGLGIPNVGDNLYSDTLDTNIEYNLETGEYIDSYTTIDKIAFGECNEASIMSVLFDLLDGTSESYDNLQYSHSILWDSAFNNLNVTTFSEFESNFSAGSKLKEIYFGQLLEEFGFSSTNLVQSSATIKTPPTLSWSSGGGSTSNPNNQFKIIVYKPSNYEVLFETEFFGNTTITLTNEQWDTLLQSGLSYVYWTVESRNSIAPTGNGYSSNSKYLSLPSTTNVYLSSNYTGTLTTGNCYWYKFIVPETGAYTFQTTGATDTYGELFENIVSGESIVGRLSNGYDDDNGDDNNFKIECELTKDQVVYIRVRGFGWNSTGSFTLSVSTENHVHNYTHSYTYTGVHNHTAFCSCGASISEIHNYVQSGVGHRCTKCLHYTTGPVIVAPITSNNDDIIYYLENKNYQN